MEKYFVTIILLFRLFLFYMLLLHIFHLFSSDICVSIARLFASREEEPCFTHLGMLPGHDKSLNMFVELN